MVPAIIVKQKRYIRAFRNVNAVSDQQAIRLDDLGIRKGPIFNGLLRRGVIRHATDEKYYLDQLTEATMMARRRKVAIIVLVIMLLALTIVFGVFK